METRFFSSPLFETIICLILVYALLSLLVSTITEAVNSYFKERGTLLFNTLSRLFEDNINVNFGQLLYSHPMIANLKKDRNSLPQYISPQMFSNTLIDVVSNYAKQYELDPENKNFILKEDHKDIFERFKAGIDQMKHTSLKLVLMNMVEKSVVSAENKAGNVHSTYNELDLLQQQLQQWFNDQMERTSGWYKTYMRTRLFWISLAVALSLNVDSIHLFQTLYRAPDLRAQLQPIAENLAGNYSRQNADTSLTALQKAYKAAAITEIKNDSAEVDSSLINKTAQIINQLKQIDSLTRNYDSSRQHALDQTSVQIDQLAALGLPIGWNKDQAPLSWSHKQKSKSSGYFEQHKVPTFWNIVSYLIGIIITAISLSFGAPFWFDLLLKAINIRRAGTKPSTDQK
jgi:hypothetical protein